jgi:hypothetical protein
MRPFSTANLDLAESPSSNDFNRRLSRAAREEQYVAQLDFYREVSTQLNLGCLRKRVIPILYVAWAQMRANLPYLTKEDRSPPSLQYNIKIAISFFQVHSPRVLFFACVCGSGRPFAGVCSSA